MPSSGGEALNDVWSALASNWSATPWATPRGPASGYSGVRPEVSLAAGSPSKFEDPPVRTGSPVDITAYRLPLGRSESGEHGGFDSRFVFSGVSERWLWPQTLTVPFRSRMLLQLKAAMQLGGKGEGGVSTSSS